MRKKEYTIEQINEMKELYLIDHLSLSKIGERYNASKNVISRVLKENQVEIRKDNHKYYADYNKFHIIDSNEKAYWLGFIAADGCIYERKENASVIINLSQKDKEHLEKFKKFMNSNVRILDHIQTDGFSNDSEMSKIVFNSKEMVQDFIDKGIVPRKSLILDVPKIDSKYYLPFILGYFDGDGSIFKTSQNTYGINIVGTFEMLVWINDLLEISYELEKRNKDNKNNFYIRCGGIQKPYLIMQKLYNSCPEIYLDRKYSIYKELETVVHDRNIM